MFKIEINNFFINNKSCQTNHRSVEIWRTDLSTRHWTNASCTMRTAYMQYYHICSDCALWPPNIKTEAKMSNHTELINLYAFGNLLRFSSSPRLREAWSSSQVYRLWSPAAPPESVPLLLFRWNVYCLDSLIDIFYHFGTKSVYSRSWLSVQIG